MLTLLMTVRESYLFIDAWICLVLKIQVEIANFELFSSSPKDFRVSISDRFPTRDWLLLGDFVAGDERTIQSFLLEEPIFGKFVKVLFFFIFHFQKRMYLFEKTVTAICCAHKK